MSFLELISNPSRSEKDAKTEGIPKPYRRATKEKKINRIAIWHLLMEQNICSKTSIPCKHRLSGRSDRLPYPIKQLRHPNREWDGGVVDCAALTDTMNDELTSCPSKSSCSNPLRHCFNPRVFSPLPCCQALPVQDNSFFCDIAQCVRECSNGKFKSCHSRVILKF